MKQTLFILLFLVTLFPLFPDQEFQNRFSQHVEQLSRLSPVREGTANEEATLLYITSVLDKEAIPYTREFLDNLLEGHSFSSNLVLDFPGYSDKTLVVAMPLNSYQNNSEALAFWLTLVQLHYNVENPVNLFFILLGGETDSQYWGTEMLLETYFIDSESSVIYLDMQQLNKRPFLIAGSEGRVTPKNFTQTVYRILANSGLNPILPGTDLQLHRLYLNKPHPPLSRYLTDEIPAITIRSQYSGKGRVSASEEYYNFFKGLLEEISELSKTEEENHYIIFNSFLGPVIIGESALIYIIMGVMALSLFYSGLRPRNIKRYVRTVGKNLWNLPLLFAIALGLLIISTHFLDAIAALKHYKLYWQQFPSLFFLTKVAVTLFLFLLVFLFIKSLPISKNGSFYSASSLLFLMMDVIIFSFLDFTLGFYFLWAYLFAFVLSVSPFRLIKVLAFLASPIWLIRAFADIYNLHFSEIGDFFLLSKLSGNLLLAFIILPFMLMFFRLDFLFHHPKKGKHGKILISAIILSGVVSFALSGILLLHPVFTPSNLQAITVTESFNQETGSHSIEMRSPATLKGKELIFEERSADVIENDLITRLELKKRGDIISETFDTEEFLNRKNLHVKLTSAFPMETLSIELRGSNNFELLDSNFAFKYENDATTLYVGRNPPNPLIIDLTVPNGTFPVLHYKAKFDELSAPVTVKGDNINIIKVLEVTDSIELES